MISFSKLFVLASLVPVSFAPISQSSQTAIPAQTKSNEYAWLEVESAKTAKFRAQNSRETKEMFEHSLNIPKIEKFLMERYPANLDNINQVEVSKNRKFVLARREYSSIVSDVQDNVAQEIFSTTSLSPDRAEIINVSLSPSREFLVIQVQMNGSIDFSRYFIYDLSAKKIKGEFDGLSYMQEPAWNSGFELVTMHPDSSPRLFSTIYVDLRTMATRTELNHIAYKFRDWLAVSSEETKSAVLANALTGEKFKVNAAIDFLNAFEETSDYFYFVLHTQTDGTVFRLKKQDQATPETLIPPRDGFWLSTLQILENRFLLVNYSKDSLVTLVLYDLVTGQKLSELALPDNYDCESATYLPRQDGIQLSLNNFLAQSYQVVWNLKDPAATNFSNLPAQFVKDGLEYISRLEYFISRDGESVPARITYLKNTVLTGANPTYVETYGAFNYISGYLFQSFGRMKTNFLKHGGILVGTGVRGGAERGRPWYLAGTGFKKANPAYDLIAIADGLVARGYTQPEKIVSTGISAGGDNVATAAQLSPASFGLVIPISGVHDSFGYLHIDRWGPQWLFDYLDPYDPRSFSSIYDRAALELRTASTRYPQYLIVSGESDTRVSKVHSYKLKASLDEFISKGVYLYSIENAGHWPFEVGLQGLPGLKSNAAIWGHVYDYLGINF